MQVEQGKQPRRSDGVSPNRVKPLPWPPEGSGLPDGADFKILSLDGGGIKGIFTAGVLAYLEERCLGGAAVGDFFDLIAGTSTGGIIALGLGAGMKAREILDIYCSEGKRVFPPPQYGNRWFRRLRNLQRLFNTRYNRERLDKLLAEMLGAKKLKDSKYRLLIPSTEAKNGDPYIYKTPHHPCLRLDGETLMSDAAAATSAAPTYLKPVIQDGYTLIDGGVWANNPAMIALVDALTFFAAERERIAVLSVGCDRSQFRISPAQEKGGGLLQWREIIYAAMHYQSLAAVNQARLLLGPDRVARLEPSENAPSIDMDDWAAAKDVLPGEAESVAAANAARIKSMFLSAKATPLTPFPPEPPQAQNERKQYETP